MSDSTIPPAQLPFFIKETVYVIPDKPAGQKEETSQKHAQAPARDFDKILESKLLILLTVSEEQLPDQLKKMLLNILQAIDAPMEETSILQIKSLEEINEILKQHPCNQVLCFGLPGSEDEYYRWITLSGKTQLLMADALDVLQEDRKLKKKLWNALQEVFTP